MANVANGNDGPKRAQGGLPVPRSSRGPKGFLQEVRREIKKVNWPTIPETHRLTGVVLGVCALMVAFLVASGTLFGFVVDFLTKL